MTIQTVSQIADAYDAGRYWTGYMRKVYSTSTTETRDLSYSAGIPVANYYASTPLVSATLGYNDGVYAGPPVSSAGFKKYLHKITHLPPSAVNIGQTNFWYHDLVMYYPFIDGDGGYQALTNSIPIPRYGGEGCRIMIVGQGAGVAVTANVYITYTNTNNIQRTVRIYFNSQVGAGTAPAIYDTWGMGQQSAYQVPVNCPYLELYRGDSGVKSIDAVDIQDAAGGIFAFCIVKPLGVVTMQEQSGAPLEVDFVRDRFAAPEIGDGANIYAVSRASTAAGTNGVHVAELSFIWG
jgi:hypothetical protein